MKHPTPPLLFRGFVPLGLAFAALLAGGTFLAADEVADPSKLKVPVTIKRVAPIHPPEMLKNLINGRAVVECLITESGAVRELKTISASKPEFGQAAEEAVQQWEFQPGEKAGQPVAVRLQIPFEFTLTTEQIIETVLHRPVFQEIRDLTISAREMPSWPRPLQYLLPRYPESLKGSGKYGKAVVSIVINKEGKVMNPRIVKATYPEFILPSLVAASRLEFPPQVMANNEHIHVSMDIQFDFKEDKPRAKGKEPAKEKPKK